MSVFRSVDFLSYDFVIESIKPFLSIKDLNNLLSVPSNELKFVRKNFFNYSLSERYSSLYLRDKKFRDYVTSKVKNTKNQISLDINFESVIRFDVDISVCNNVHTLKLSYGRNITDLSSLTNVRVIELLSCRNITDVSTLGNVHTLKIYT